MIATPDETAASLASALVRARRAGSGRRIALSNGPVSGSVIPLMDRRAFLGTLTGSLLAAPLVAEAQQARIGWLTPAVTEDHSRAFREAMRALGYVDGQTVAFESRPAEDNPAVAPAASGPSDRVG